MHNTQRIGQAPWCYAITTTDAYSFSYYGPEQWEACWALLFRRGYNAAEAISIMRSKLTRFAADGREHEGFATADDLGRFLDRCEADGCGVGLTLRACIDDYVLGIMGEGLDQPPPAPFPRPRLVWSRHG